MKKILLVEPDFPYSNKSKNKASSTHKNFVPLGLLKFGALHKSKGNKVKLVRGKLSKRKIGFVPNEILVTTLFTYWSSYVWDSISHYRKLFPKSIIRVGGIYATLHADTKKFKRLARKYKTRVSRGVHLKAEKYLPDYSLISEIDYHATHMMRGCIRKCKFCGTWKLEPERTCKPKQKILEELKVVGKNKVIFYDNNILANPDIKNILRSFQDLRINDSLVMFESQSGFDGRLLENDSELSALIKIARFQNVRIAWDNSIKDKKSIKKQIDNLVGAGYPAKDISVFMIYNFDIPIEEMIRKQKYCLKWGVQITDCRNRPLDIDYDNYNPHSWRMGQTSEDYYIHKESGWTDHKIRMFRKIVRIHNITIRYVKDKKRNFDELLKKYMKIRKPEKCLKFMETKIGYKRKMEKWSAIHNTFKFFNLGRPPTMRKINKDVKLQKKIKMLNKIKNHFKGNNIQSPDLSSYSQKELKIFIRNYRIL